MASFPGASSLVLLAFLAAAAAADAHNYKMVFKVEDCHGKPVQGAEVKVWGCVKDSKKIESNKDGLAIFQNEVQYCDLPHSDKLCHWSATKDGDDFSSSDETLMSKPQWWSWNKAKQCSPKELSGCDCKSKCLNDNRDAAYHKTIVLKQKNCKPVACKAEWSTEGCSCSATCEKPQGYSDRVFKIITQAKNGGKACQYKDGHKEKVPCHLKDFSKCAKDCVGYWKHTTSCDATCAKQGKREETFIVTKPAAFGGKCPNEGKKRIATCELSQEQRHAKCKVDCKGEWTTVGCKTCSATCEKPEGYSERMFKIITQAKNGGKACQFEDGHKEKVPCQLKNYSKCAKDCEGYWKHTKSCDATCTKQGKREEAFTVTKPAAHGGKCPNNGKKRTVACELTPEQRHAKCKVDCKGEWTTVGCKPCSATCEKPKGHSERMFKIITQAENGGKACQYKDGHKEKVPCQLKDYSKCGVNCVGDWTVTKNCTATCSHPEGYFERTFKVTTPAKYGGKPCQYPDGFADKEPCHLKGDSKCPKDCEGYYKKVEACNATCAHPQGVIVEHFVITHQPANGGKACPPAVEYKPCKLNDYEREGCKVDCAGKYEVTQKCNATCDHPSGTIVKKFKITQEPKYGGAACPEEIEYECCGLKQSEAKKCIKDCKGSYQLYKPCNASCENPEGVIIKKFLVTQEPTAGGKQCPPLEIVKPCSLTPSDLECCKVDCQGYYKRIERCNATCEHPEGVEVRKFIVKQEPKFGGKACRPGLEYKTCSLREWELEKCKRDCKGYWSKIQACNATCGSSGYKAERFEVTCHAQYGGKPCDYKDGDVRYIPCERRKPCGEDCVGEFMWGECSATACGTTGFQFKVFKVLKNKTYTGEDCTLDDGAKLLSDKTCSAEPCPKDCEGYYVLDQECNSTCAHPEGVIVKKFYVTQQPDPTGKACPPLELIKPCHLRDYESCKNDCCGEYEASNCTATCAHPKGVVIKKFKVKQQPEYGGDACPGDLVEECSLTYEEIERCKVDCNGEYETVKNCTASCDNPTGMIIQKFKVTQPPLYGGDACPKEKLFTHCYLSQQEKDECKRDCKGYYKVAKNCTATCDQPKGYKMEEFVVEEPPAYGGEECPKDKITECELTDYELNECKEDCKGYWEVKKPCTADCDNHEGVIVQKFIVTKPAKYGGYCPEDKNITKCYLSLEEKQQCKVNCTGHYEVSTNCTATCDDPNGYQVEHFVIKTPPGYGGAECPKDKTTECTLTDAQTQDCSVDCVGEYETVKNCTASCDDPTGVIVQKFKVTQEPRDGGKACPKEKHVTHCYLSQEELDGCKEDCEGYWKTVKNCTADCYNHEGVIVQKFTVTKPAKYGGYCPEDKNITKCYLSPEEIEDCKVNCTGEYVVSMNCTATCDRPYGYQVEHFVIETQPAYGGAECPNDKTTECTLTEEQKQNCSLDCKGEYETVKDCTASCDNPTGVIVQKFKVTQQPRYGGKACPPEKNITECSLSQEELEGCKVNCTGKYEIIKDCTASCAHPEGYVIRKFVVDTEPKYGGAECPPEIIKDKCYLPEDELKDCNKDCEGDFEVICSAKDCKDDGWEFKVFHITQSKTGNGKECKFKDGDKFPLFKKCREAGCPTDCKGEWKNTNECSASACGTKGYYYDVFYIAQNKTEGGKDCLNAPGDKQEDKHRWCYGPPCPRDCKGYWMEVKPCNATCGTAGYKTENFVISCPATAGGKPCNHTQHELRYVPCNRTKPCGKDCQGEFVLTEMCSAEQCGTNGTYFKVFRITQNKTAGGCDCTYKEGYEIPSDVPCSAPECPKVCPDSCKAMWEVTECDTEGLEYTHNSPNERKLLTKTCDTRTVEIDGKCSEDNPLIVTALTVTPPPVVCPEYYPTASNTPCNGTDCGVCCIPEVIDCKFKLVNKTCPDCGEATKATAQVEITQNATLGGKRCMYQGGEVYDGNTVTTDEDCPAKECPVDCEGDWKPTEECSAECGAKGQYYEVFHITVPSANGGEDCSYADGEKREKEGTYCYGPPCPVDCEGDWKPTEECSAECGAKGQYYEVFHITVPSANGGEDCSYADGEKREKEGTYCYGPPCPELCPEDCKTLAEVREGYTEGLQSISSQPDGRKLLTYNTRKVEVHGKCSGAATQDLAVASHPAVNCPESYPQASNTPCNGTNCGVCCIPRVEDCKFKLVNESCPACGPAAKASAQVVITQAGTPGGKRCLYKGKEVKADDTVMTDKFCPYKDCNPPVDCVLQYVPVACDAKCPEEWSGSTASGNSYTVVIIVAATQNGGKCAVSKNNTVINKKPCSIPCTPTSCPINAPSTCKFEFWDNFKKYSFDGTCSTTLGSSQTECPDGYINSNQQCQEGNPFCGVCCIPRGNACDATYNRPSGEGGCKNPATKCVCFEAESNSQGAACQKATFPPSYEGNVGVGGGCREKGCNALYRKLSNGKKGGACCPAPCNN